MNFILIEGKKLKTISLITGLSFLVILLVAAGNISCTQQAEEQVVEEEAAGIQIGTNEIEGVVKVGVGKYFFMPEAQGIDMVVPSPMESGDASSLVDQVVKVKGEFFPEKPTVLVLESIEVKEAEGQYRNIYTSTGEAVIDDYVDPITREEFKVLKDIDYSKKEGWEGKEKAKVYGELEKTTITEGEEEKEIYKIIVLDENEKQVGKIVVDNITDYGLYYMKKLRLYDKFWFYFNINETVDWSIRRKTRELFHADVVFAGLF